MVRIRPKVQNKKEIPVNIFRGEELIAKCPSIQKAAEFFKRETEAKRFNWSAINNGIWYNQPFSLNGVTYYFTTDEIAVKNKLKKVWWKGGIIEVASEKLREEFIRILETEFPSVRFKNTKLKSRNTRISSYIINHKKNKRWMQLDVNPKYFAIAMDHSKGDITEDDIFSLNLPYGLNGNHSAIQLQKNDNAVNFSIFKDDPYDFSNSDFIKFLHKHYNSYLKLVGR
jgi:hypothetical protein